VLKRHHHCENNELVELPVLHYKEQQVYAFVETLMPHAIQIRRALEARATSGSTVLTNQPNIHRSLP
jgi:hypothetical protein